MTTTERRMAFLSTEDDTGKKVAKIADFNLMTITTTSTGGYGTGSEKRLPITSAGAEAFWSGFVKITPLRNGDCHQVDGNSWNANCFDGGKSGMLTASSTTTHMSGQHPIRVHILNLFDSLTCYRDTEF